MFNNSDQKWWCRLLCLHRISPKCWKNLIVISISLTLLAILLVFVVFPFLFMFFVDVQRYFLFQPVKESAHKFQLASAERGGRNIYVTVNTSQLITLGAWHFLPKALYNDFVYLKINHSDLLARGDYPVLFHCHGNAANRMLYMDVYMKLTEYFHVFAFDYRNYGDSTPGDLTEECLIDDTVALFKWLRNNTSADIYVWGHSMGTAVATHAVAALKMDGIVPMGLVLESPYTTLREEILRYPLASLMAWLPWFNTTMLDPIWYNGFRFETVKHIVDVDCPIMILHSKDDDVIPYDLAVKLHDAAVAKRNADVQGPVRLHLFPAELKYRHWAIYKSPLLTKYVKEHMYDAQQYKFNISHAKV